MKKIKDFDRVSLASQSNDAILYYLTVRMELKRWKNSQFFYISHYFKFCYFSEIATLTHKFSSVTLYRNKTVRYAARMHAIIACQMEFQLYPMDIQVCPIYIESCRYSIPFFFLIIVAFLLEFCIEITVTFFFPFSFLQ